MSEMSDPSTPEPINFSLVQRYLESREEDRQTLARLEVAFERLSGDSQALRASLDTYATKGDVAQAAVDQIEAMKKTEKTRLEALVALRLGIRKQTWILFGIILLLLIAACTLFGIGWYSTHQEFQRYKADRFAACESANAEKTDMVNKTKQFMTPLLAQERARKQPDPVLVTILAVLATQQPQISHCSK